MLHRVPLLLVLAGALYGCSGDENAPTSSSTTAATTTTGSSSGPGSSVSSGSGGAGGGGGSGGGGAAPAGTVELVGHSDLGARGMNAALAVAGNYVYVGSRIDGAKANSGILIVDVSNTASPAIVGSIEGPNEALLGVSSRELRAIPDKNLLIVLNFYCGTALHGCTYNTAQFPTTGGAAEKDNMKFYDISNPVAPTLIATYDFGSYPGVGAAKPHEFFLWRDPTNPDRTLLYVSTPTGPPVLKVLDISDLSNITLVSSWDAPIGPVNRQENYIHSLSLSDDGKTAYLAYLGSGFFMADTSAVAAGMANPMIPLITPYANRIDYAPPAPPGTHSALKIPNRDVVLLTDELYPPPYSPGCPWGWARFVDIANPAMPTIVSEYKVAENEAAFCSQPGANTFDYTAHNPTLTEHLAVITWHAAGMLVLDTTDATKPKLNAVYMPTPLPSVATEDPALGGKPVAMWSYPVIKDGLIYVIDIRNGLYILRYKGPYEQEISTIPFAEGNSNL